MRKSDLLVLKDLAFGIIVVVVLTKVLYDSSIVISLMSKEDTRAMMSFIISLGTYILLREKVLRIFGG